MWRTIYKLTKTFADVPAPRRLVENVKMKIEKFRQHVPVLTISCNPGLKARHWQQVWKLPPPLAARPWSPLVTPGRQAPLWVKRLLSERSMLAAGRGA